MPTYEYRCPNGHAFEVFQKMSDDPGASCPECGADAERKLSGGAGFLFKGDGFYITDYRSESYKKAAAKEKEAATGKPGDSASGGSGSSSSESPAPSPPKPSGGADT